MKQIEGQMELQEYIKSIKRISSGCDCICMECLYWWSGRCPYGNCYDDRRAKEIPYDKAYPDRPPRTAWGNWNKPGEQAHWCRGGIFYPVQYCERFVKYHSEHSIVKTCLGENVQIFQDGYILCSLADTVGCEECYRRFIERQKE